MQANCKLFQPTNLPAYQSRMLWVTHVAQSEDYFITSFFFLCTLNSLALSSILINRRCGDIVGATGLFTIRERT